jgi:hypothetical protein
MKTVYWYHRLDGQITFYIFSDFIEIIIIVIMLNILRTQLQGILNVYNLITYYRSQKINI